MTNRNIWGAVLIFHLATMTMVAVVALTPHSQWYQTVGQIVLSGWAMFWVWRGRKSERAGA